MKISDAKQALESDFFDYVEIRKNPADMSQYIVLLYSLEGRSFMLCYENDSVLSSAELEHIILMLKEIGFRKARLYF